MKVHWGCTSTTIVEQADGEKQVHNPPIANLFYRLSGVRLFTKLDLRLGYYQVRIVEGDESKTAYVTHYDSYMFLIRPFGLTHTSIIFCTLMNKMLGIGVQWKRKF